MYVYSINFVLNAQHVGLIHLLIARHVIQNVVKIQDGGVDRWIYLFNFIKTQWYPSFVY